MIIGIDIGGTKIAAGIVRNGKILKAAFRWTEREKGKRHVLAQLRSAVAELEQHGKITGIGIGVPGVYHGTKIIDLTNLHELDGTDLKKALKMTVPIVLDNDARCFTLAEHMYGAAKGAQNVIGHTLGTGFGTGLIINGKIYKGAHGYAGELSRTIINPLRLPFEGKKRPLGLESFFGGANILKRHRARGGTEKYPSDIWTGGSRVAKVTLAETSMMLALHVSNMAKTIDPDVIVFGGGVAHPVLVREIRKRVPQYLAFPPPKVKMSRLGKNAGIIGAATLLEQRT